MAHTDLQPMNDRTHRRMHLALRLYNETPSFTSTPAKLHQRKATDIFLSYNAGTLTQLQYKYMMSAYAGQLKCLEAVTNSPCARPVVFILDCARSQPYVPGTPRPELYHAKPGDIGLVVSYSFIKRYVKTVTLVLNIMMPDAFVFTDVSCAAVRDIPGYLALLRRRSKIVGPVQSDL